MTTRYSKDHDGHRATTSSLLPNGLTLKVTTRKGSNGNLTTTASCCKRDTTDGIGFETHRVFQDFYQTIAKQKARCTEKTIKTMHEAALLNFDLITQEALNHYNTPEYIAKHGKENDLQAS